MKKYQQILLVAFVVLFWDSTSFLMDYFNTKVEALEQQIASLEDTVAENEDLYKESVVNMVENIYRTDSFLNVGGGTEILDYDVESFFLVMNQNTHELNTFLGNAENFFNERTAYFDQIPDIWPVEQHPLNRVTSAHGARFDPFTLKTITDHRGTDIDSYHGAPVLATASGKVKDHWIYDKTYGRSVRLSHDNNFMTFYGHMSKVIVHEGDYVKKGQVIGYIGMTGKATGPHIHYEIIKDGVKVDPTPYLRRTI